MTHTTADALDEIRALAAIARVRLLTEAEHEHLSAVIKYLAEHVC